MAKAESLLSAFFCFFQDAQFAFHNVKNTDAEQHFEISFSEILFHIAKNES